MTEVPLNTLKPGARFRSAYPPYFDYTGTLIFVSPCRALVEIDAPEQTRSFTDRRTGKTVTFTAPGCKRVSWAPETPVTPLGE